MFFNGMKELEYFLQKVSVYFCSYYSWRVLEYRKWNFVSQIYQRKFNLRIQKIWPEHHFHTTNKTIQKSRRIFENFINEISIHGRIDRTFYNKFF